MNNSDNNFSTTIWNWLKYFCRLVIPTNPDFISLYFRDKITWPKLNSLQIGELLEKEMTEINSEYLTDSFLTETGTSEYSIEDNESFWNSLMEEIRPNQKINEEKFHSSIVNYCKAQVSQRYY